MIYNINEILGKNLKMEREKRNLSQEKFAELLGIGIPALSKIECGKSYPKQETLENIIEVLNIKPDILFVTNNEINIDEMYQDILSRLEKAKGNKDLFSKIYERIVEMTILIN